MPHPSPNVERLVSAVALAFAFGIMASVFVPDKSTANNDEAALPAAPTTKSNHDPHAGLASLGSVEGVRHTASIFATDHGPRYTVHDRATGEELGALMTAEEAAEWFPDLPLPSMGEGAEGPLMLSEPHEMGWE